MIDEQSKTVNQNVNSVEFKVSWDVPQQHLDSTVGQFAKNGKGGPFYQANSVSFDFQKTRIVCLSNTLPRQYDPNHFLILGHSGMS